MVIALSLLLILLLLFGFPLWLIFLMTSLGVFYISELPISVELIASRIYSSLDVYVLLAIPGFIFATEVMTRSGMAKRLIDLIRIAVGRVPGGIAITTVVAAEAFGSVCGSSMATISAIGKALYPGLRESRYSESFSLGLITSMGAIALIIPPGITMILYGAVASVSVVKLFLAGVVPGIVIGLLIAIYSITYALKNNVASGNAPFRWKATVKAAREAFWTLLSPVIIFGGIYGGFFTPTEASIVLSLYCIVVALFIYRSIDLRGLWDASLVTAYLVSKIFLIVAAASTMSLILVLADIPDRLLELIAPLHASPSTVLLAINVILIIAGMFIEPFPAIVILVPLFAPLVASIGINEIHFGIIVIVNLAIGMFAPPFGLNIFMSSSILNVSALKVGRSCVPFMAIYLLALGLITYVPAISLWLPNIWG